MSWRDRIQKASFRGVEFAVEGAEGTFGRRGVVHEYPLRDKPYIEDLGRRMREISLEALVIGADYMAARDRLLAALEQAGPGQLVHPYLGQMLVSIVEARLRESTAEGGMARFSITCLESGDYSAPTVEVSTADAVRAVTEEVIGQCQADYLDEVEVPGSDTVQLPLRERLAMFNGQVQSLIKTISVQAADVTLGVRSLRTLVAEVTRALAAPMLVAQVVAMALQDVRNEVVKGLGGDLQAAAATARASLTLSTYARMFGVCAARAPQPLGTAGSDALAMAQSNLLAGLLGGLVLAHWAEISTLVGYASRDDASQRQDALTDAIDALRDRPETSPRMDAHLAALRAAVVHDLSARSADLARVVQMSVPASVPSVALAYRLYAGLGREADLLARNGVRNPLFMPAGVPLEVLTDGR